jgi:hypothetical protein
LVGPLGLLLISHRIKNEAKLSARSAAAELHPKAAPHPTIKEEDEGTVARTAHGFLGNKTYEASAYSTQSHKPAQHIRSSLMHEPVEAPKPGVPLLTSPPSKAFSQLDARGRMDKAPQTSSNPQLRSSEGSIRESGLALISHLYAVIDHFQHSQSHHRSPTLWPTRQSGPPTLIALRLKLVFVISLGDFTSLRALSMHQTQSLSCFGSSCSKSPRCINWRILM